MGSSMPPVVLFGYDCEKDNRPLPSEHLQLIRADAASPFTQKVRLVLKLKQIPYTFVVVPSMMPRPVLRDNFHLTYRKIPVLAIGHEVYCDTSLIIEVLEYTFSKDHPSIYPPAADGKTNRSLIRGFASYWTDRPFFRVTTGLIPSSVWRTHFGTDRAGLIGHKLNPDKLETKVPRNLSGLDMHLSILETQFQSADPWIFSTPHPSLADISLYYQLDWGQDIAAGRGIENLTGGSTKDTDNEGASSVFNSSRYPALLKWYRAMKQHFASLPATENRVSDPQAALNQMKEYKPLKQTSLLLPTPTKPHFELDRKTGLVPGVKVSIAPDDTGRDDPTIGWLVDLSPEEVVIKPLELDTPALLDVRVHFPRLGFVVQPFWEAKL